MNIAIVAMQGVFPGAEDVDLLSKNINSGIVSIHEFPATTEEKPGQNWIHRRPLLENSQFFDAEFFGLSANRGRRSRPAASVVDGAILAGIGTGWRMP
ncbi:TPA: beta-ketoacyl synthase N-terminal-like domain-containing protein [Serratia marcescens]|uniref:beta-ketoacyl synthase N-terminal-like domain-containing protein n=1 Tax=Serratia nevei TaxID=2703794 RepID=UPI00313CFBDF